MGLIRPSGGAFSPVRPEPRRRAITAAAGRLPGRRRQFLSLPVGPPESGSARPDHGGGAERIDAAARAGRPRKRRERKVKAYSTGMRQRLGVAAALLGDPEMVILDEPVNGLDVAGIQEMRHLIRSLAADRGKTVFLSSHLLSEVQQVCDRVAIINQGKMIHESTIADLLHQATALGSRRRRLRPRRRRLAGAGQSSSTARRCWSMRRGPTRPRWLAGWSERGWTVHAVAPMQGNLEDIFLAMTQGGSDRCLMRSRRSR